MLAKMDIGTVVIVLDLMHTQLLSFSTFNWLSYSRCGKNVFIFGAENSPSVHTENRKKIFYFFRKV